MRRRPFVVPGGRLVSGGRLGVEGAELRLVEENERGLPVLARAFDSGEEVAAPVLAHAALPDWVRRPAASQVRMSDSA